MGQPFEGRNFRDGFGSSFAGVDDLVSITCFQV